MNSISDRIPFSGHGWGAFVCPRPVGTPEATEDGRPFVPKHEDKPLESLLWMPKPPREGDLVYCRGVRFGTLHGDDGAPDKWKIVTAPMDNLIAAPMKGKN